jgi:hypothetical protein
MTWMRRIPALVIMSLLALAPTACGGNDAVVPSGTPSPLPSPSPSPGPSVPPTPTPSPSPPPAPALQLPSDAPTTFADPLEPDAVPPEALIPPEASVTSTWTLVPPDDPIALIGVAWSRGADPFAAEHGFVVWERFEQTPPWRAVYGFTDTPKKDVVGVRFNVDDLTADGIPDALTFEDTGGSGACGTWRVISPSDGAATEIFRQQTCDTQIINSAGTLKIRQAVFAPDDAHCCPSSFHITILRWNGQAFVTIREADSGGASA